MPDVGLYVEAATGEPRAARTENERLGSFAQQPEGGGAWVTRLRRCDDPVHLGAFARGNGGLDRQFRSRLQLGTGREADQQQ